MAAQAAWRLFLLATVALAPAWDALGLLVGDSVYVSPSYDVLRHLTPWGMRAYGPTLTLLVALTVYAYGRHSGDDGVRGYRLLRSCLSMLAAWYALWTVGIVGAFWTHGQILTWDVGKLLLVAVFFVILARTTPTERVRG